MSYRKRISSQLHAVDSYSKQNVSLQGVIKSVSVSIEEVMCRIIFNKLPANAHVFNDL